MRKIISVFIIMFSIFLVGCSNPELSASQNVIYASDIVVENFANTYYVGDSLSIDNINITITPTNATVKPIITTTDFNLVTIANNTISFIAAGSCNIGFAVETGVNTYKNVSFEITIINKPVYAETISFNHSYIEVNLDSVASNILTITPSNCSVMPIITYSNNNIVEYNYLTGVITPIAEGSTTVTAKILSSNNEYYVSSFNVKVTNIIVATSIDADVIGMDDLTLKTGYSGVVNTTIIPSDYNQEIIYIASNNLLTINNKGEFVIGDIPGNTTITIKAKSADGYITKQIKIDIIKPLKNIDAVLLLNDVEPEKFYVGVEYLLNINSEVDCNNIHIYGCNYTLVDNNSYNIVFTTTGLIDFKIEYLYEFSNESLTVKFEDEVNVYNVINDFSLSLINNSVELIPTNNEYTLSMINNAFVDDAFEDGVYGFANFNVTALGGVCDSLGYNISIDDQDVITLDLQNKLITANKPGTAILTVSSLDPGAFEKEYIITVVKTDVEDLVIADTSIELNLEDNTTANLTYFYLPVYAYNVDYVIDVEGDSISVNENTIVAQKLGTSLISITAGSITKLIEVNVVPVPNNISIVLNQTNLVNNQTINMLLNDNVIIAVNLLYDETPTNKYAAYELIGNSIKIDGVNNNALKLTAISAGNSTLTFTYKTLSFNLNINVIEQNKILSAKFANDNMQVNMFDSTYVALNPQFSYENNSKPTTDVVTYQSTNSQVAVIEDNNLKLMAEGETTIKLLVNGVEFDSFILTVINKAIIEISSVEQLQQVSNKSYKVVSNLDMSNFTTLENFEGELDFNGCVITNLKMPLFTTISSNALVKNLKINSNIALSNASVNNHAIIAITNNGTISNIQLENCSVSVNQTLNNVIYLSLICFNNNGTIFDINFNNVTVSDSRTGQTVNTSRFGGVAINNYGLITGVNGKLIINNFVRTSGVCDLTNGAINNVDLDVNITTCEKFVGAGVAYRVDSAENTTTFENIDLNITLNGNENIKSFGAVFNAVRNNVVLNNIEANTTLNMSYSNEKVGLFVYEILSTCSATSNNCYYTNIGGYSALISGTINNLIAK